MIQDFLTRMDLLKRIIRQDYALVRGVQEEKDSIELRQASLAQDRLTQAEDALHQLRTGARVVEVRTDTESVKYAPADAAGLAAYVAQLRRQLGEAPRAAAIGVRFR